ncbi:MAG: pilus assembly protein PilP [Nitrospinota bacterium]|nr:pilus assembly protein PilP [Nitrospinota bacterium]
MTFGISAAVAVAAPEKEMTSLERLDKALAADKYVYNPAGTRDPFRSVLEERLIRRDKSGRELASKVPFTPLQKFDVLALKLTAVFWGEMGSYAIVDAPDGKGYTIKLGTFLGKNSGVVTAILQDMIVVDEQYIDIDDAVRVRKVTLKLKPEEKIE